jgi:hypothetical protein
MPQPIDLEQLPQLATLFALFNNGVHLNRAANASLWAQLEQQQDDYVALFAALGYTLKLDGRGFAWFHTESVSSNISAQSRQLALLFMVIFDTQADAGKALSRFGDWHIDRALLAEVVEQHKQLLDAENLNADDLANLLDKAYGLGLAQRQHGHWQLLPAVHRYLDHFEALAKDLQTDDFAIDADSFADDTPDDADDDEVSP